MKATTSFTASPFHDLNESLHSNDEPDFDPFTDPINPFLLQAVANLKDFLSGQNHMGHDFGLDNIPDSEPIGKMFGVLLVRTKDAQLGYLAAFSGKVGGRNLHEGFVPPIYDSVDENGFLPEGMRVLRMLSQEIESISDTEQKKALIAKRAKTSADLQNRLFDQYSFSNRAGEQKNLRKIFNDELAKNPPTAAGECAAPKLLQYAYEHELEPLALAEFWWGGSTRSVEMKHGEFYPPCEDKCRPILKHMLS